jgi:hypothetical protein
VIKMETTTVLTLAVLLLGGILLGMKICFASKCDEVKLCYGLLSIHRNVSVENPEISNNESLGTQITQMRNVASRNLEVERTLEEQSL